MNAIKKVELTIVSFIIGAAIVAGMALLGYSTARGDSGSDVMVDDGVFVDAGAGSAVGSGSGVVAVPVVIVPDPTTQPVEAVSTIASLWKNGTIPAAIIVTVFMLLTILDKKKVLKGRQAVAVSALLAGIMVLIERAASGTTPNAAMFLTAGVTSLALFIRPDPKPVA